MSSGKADEKQRFQWEPPDYAELVVVTFILELPQDLCLPSGASFGLSEEREDVFVGWRDEDKTAFTGIPILTPGRSPLARLVFKNAIVRMPLPLQAADVAFGDWIRPLISFAAWESRSQSLEEASSSGLGTRKTVAAATRFVPPASWGETMEQLFEMLTWEFDQSLDFLNDFLVSLSMVRGDPSLTPVARGDLHAACPVIVEAAPTPEARRCGTTFLYPVHEELPTFARDVGEIDEETRAELAELAGLRRYNEFPMLLYYELLNSAEGARRLHRYAPAVATLGTALEVLVTAVIRMIGSGHDHDEDAVDRALKAPLRNQIEHHLPRYVNVEVDLSDGNNAFGRWWLGGYKLRNAVMHEGHRPNGNEVDNAFEDAAGFVEAVAAGTQPETAEDPSFLIMWPFART